MIILEPDQGRLVTGVRSSMAAGNRWVLMQAATGAGKTVMGADIIHGSRNKGTRSMMVVPRKELLKQTALTFRGYDIPFSYCAAGYETNPFAKTFLATTQTLAQRIKDGKAPDVNLVLMDETHYGGATIDAIIGYYKTKGARGVGLTATPWLMSGQGMECWYDDMVCGESIAWLMEAGRLSNYRMFAPSQPDLTKVRSVAGDYARSDLGAFMRANAPKLVGDAVGHYKKHAMGKLAVAYCVSVEESELTAMRFNEAGIPAASIDGRMTDDERDKIIKAFSRREILVLCNCELLTFGFDLSAASGLDVTVEVMIDLQPTQSLTRQMQKWGRVLRRKPFPALIFDHAGNVSRHGYPDDHRNWTLHGKKKRGGFSAGGVPVKNCTGGYKNSTLEGEKMPPCYFSHRPAPRCPNCGAWYELDARTVKVIDGELGEQDARARRPFTPEEIKRLNEAIDARTIAGRKKGMPQAVARRWAIETATEEAIERAARADLQITMHLGDRELKI